jgi:hypothetical protein
MKGAENAEEVGDATRQEGDVRNLRNHAEQRWWDLSGNPRAITTKSAHRELERFEFEVTIDFCKNGDESGRPTCRKRFSEARFRAGKGKLIYIFIMKPQIYYEVNDAGAVLPGGAW